MNCVLKISKKNQKSINDLKKETKAFVKKNKLRLKKNNPFSSDPLPSDIDRRSISDDSIIDRRLSKMIENERKFLKLSDEINILREKMGFLYDELRKY